MDAKPLVGVVMGSRSDWPTMEHAARVLPVGVVLEAEPDRDAGGGALDTAAPVLERGYFFAVEHLPDVHRLRRDPGAAHVALDCVAVPVVVPGVDVRDRRGPARGDAGGEPLRLAYHPLAYRPLRLRHAAAAAPRDRLVDLLGRHAELLRERRLALAVFERAMVPRGGVSEISGARDVDDLYRERGMPQMSFWCRRSGSSSAGEGSG